MFDRVFSVQSVHGVVNMAQQLLNELAWAGVVVGIGIIILSGSLRLSINSTRTSGRTDVTPTHNHQTYYF